MNEMVALGEKVPEQRRITFIVARLRPGLRVLAVARLEMEPGLGYKELNT